jgi:hypothetical protein
MHSLLLFDYDPGRLVVYVAARLLAFDNDPIIATDAACPDECATATANGDSSTLGATFGASLIDVRLEPSVWTRALPWAPPELRTAAPVASEI